VHSDATASTAVRGRNSSSLGFSVRIGDNWDPRVVDGFAAAHRMITFDNRGVGASSGAPAASIEQMAKDAITFIKAVGSNRWTSSGSRWRG
jgi:pimeloyl-ACP methyl ester carboxylesterase